MSITTIGLDLSKNVFQLHGVDHDGNVLLRKRLPRGRVINFFAKLEPCLIGIEASGGAHQWARELKGLGHDVRLMAPAYVKPYVKRGKTDAADAEAICEAVTRPTMRFIPIKSTKQQGALVMHRVRNNLVGQRTALSNLLRSQMTEFGVVMPQGMAYLSRLADTIEDSDNDSLPTIAQQALRLVLAQIAALNIAIKSLGCQIADHARCNEVARRLQTIPGVGPIISSAMVASVTKAHVFASGRSFAAWLGLTPKACSSGMKERQSGISKMGDRYLRQLLVVGATSVLRRNRRGADPIFDFAARLLETKPPRLVTIAVANKLARIIWALMTRGNIYRTAT